ncbi:hypothetical protein A8B79_07760 [Balneola sp. EhC07]|nr:hypothetical protein A8B79_07760 [Balneola sp. EhC07]
MAGNCFNHREHKGFLGWDFNNDFLAGLRVSLPNVRKRTRVGQVIDAKVLNLLLKGDRSNTCVRSEGCCAAFELVNRTHPPPAIRRTPPSKEDFFYSKLLLRISILKF